MIAIDTNILIYAHRSGTDEHRAARRVIERAAGSGEEWGISLASVGEFWSIVTHPKAMGRPSTPTEASDFLTALAETAAMQTWVPGPGFGPRLLACACDLELSGVRIFDLQIALTAFDNGATQMWTHDVNFIRLPGLRVIDPL
ncbi:MAG: toxin-antitoxin system PIN domain toxin [Hyphomicrobiaceae bacterium]